ncbi:MAG TPA: hypothetical protein VGK48_25850 [Terriglobia bacterium]|jgi:hypothetical protein
MKTKFLSLCLILFPVLAVSTILSSTLNPRDVTVHEWGTFTSVAGEDGVATPWRTYGGREDLPCFVDSFGGFKSQIPGTVRMETPVLYFYSSQEATADVKVAFPKGTMTDWYPQASTPPNGSIEWRNVRILPRAEQSFPQGSGPSHYYLARETDAAPLQVGTQTEKFLFYRGVGSFPLPISARLTPDGRVQVKSLDDNTVNGVILFENRGGKLGYTVVGQVHGEVTLDRSSLQNNRAGLFKALERALTDQGLYAREAHAMIQTWSDSWFEEGARLFYILPRPTVDSVLPLAIQPAPAKTNRVFVGRTEIITPEIQSDVRQALARRDVATLEKYGRFLEPIAQRIGAHNPLLDSIYESHSNRAATCSR